MLLSRRGSEAPATLKAIDAVIEIISGIFAFPNIRKMPDSRINQLPGDGRAITKPKG
jgi:hypothetical protein